MKPTLFLLFCCIVSYSSFSQDTLLRQIPPDYLTEVTDRIKTLENKLDKTGEKALAQLQKREEKLQRKLSRIDSSKAKEVFKSANDKYAGLQHKLNSKKELTQYIPYLDTLKTSFLFLSQHKELVSSVREGEEKIERGLY